MVAGKGVSGNMGRPSDTPSEKQLKCVLRSVGDEPEAKSPGIPFNGANDNDLLAELLSTKEAFVDFDNAGEP